MPDIETTFRGERIDELNRLRAEFSGWWFSLDGHHPHEWRAQRRPGFAWLERSGGITQMQTAGPVLLRELIREAELLDVRYRGVRR